MSIVDKYFYNQASSEKLGWEPDWFGASDFEDDLIKKIRNFQRKHGLTPDGLCGPGTYRRIFTERQSDTDLIKPEVQSSTDNYIICNSKKIPINWDKVVLWDDQGGLICKEGTYSSYAGKEERKVTMFVNHWDVCLSAESCAKVIEKRGISVHFNIDNDGTIYQLLDTQHAAWQAGNRTVNHCSVGVEISNAYYQKYQSWYEKNGFGPRPVWSDVEVHERKLKPFLGFYDVQMEAAAALWKAIHDAYGIPLDCPRDSNGKMLKTVDPSVPSGEFQGVVHHFHVTKRKIDAAGFPIDEYLEKIK